MTYKMSFISTLLYSRDTNGFVLGGIVDNIVVPGKNDDIVNS